MGGAAGEERREAEGPARGAREGPDPAPVGLSLRIRRRPRALAPRVAREQAPGTGPRQAGSQAGSRPPPALQRPGRRRLRKPLPRPGPEPHRANLFSHRSVSVASRPSQGPDQAPRVVTELGKVRRVEPLTSLPPGPGHEVPLPERPSRPFQPEHVCWFLKGPAPRGRAVSGPPPGCAS